MAQQYPMLSQYANQPMGVVAYPPPPPAAQGGMGGVGGMGGMGVSDEEPMYVNAKQYHRILKRRTARAKLEAELKIARQKKVALRVVVVVVTVVVIR